MVIAKVVGSAVATLKHELLKTNKLLLVRLADPEGNATGAPFLALDLVGAGPVLAVWGANVPLDAVA